MCSRTFFYRVPSCQAHLVAKKAKTNNKTTDLNLFLFLLQLGCALGFLVPPEIVPNSDDLGFIGYRLSLMFYGGAAITSCLFILVSIGKVMTIFI